MAVLRAARLATSESGGLSEELDRDCTETSHDKQPGGAPAASAPRITADPHYPE